VIWHAKGSRLQPSPLTKINQNKFKSTSPVPVPITSPHYQSPSRPVQDPFKTPEKFRWKSIWHGLADPIPSFKKAKITKTKAKESSKTQDPNISFKT
jgi:hypothetical protein